MSREPRGDAGPKKAVIEAGKEQSDTETTVGDTIAEAVGRLLGSLARPQCVGRLKAARGYPTRPDFGLRRSSEYNFVPDTWERMPHSILLIHLRALRSPIVVHRWGSVRVLGGSRSKFRRWALGRDCMKCQTFVASPAEPGDLLY
jgi:hypothetical protein